MSELTHGGSGAPRRRSWRKAAAAGAALAVGLASTIALAEWLANGTGEGYARATVAEALTTESATVQESLYPGGTGDLVLRINNPNPFPVTVTSVTQDGTITSDDSACDTGGHGVALAPQTVSLAVPASSAQTFTLADAVSMAATSDDACQGALFTIPVSLNGGSGDDDGGTGIPDCDDGDAATVDSYDDVTESCVNTLISCDDGNPWTIDSFVADTCVNESLPVGTACDDGNPMTINDMVDGAGACFGEVAAFVYYLDSDNDTYGDPEVAIGSSESSPPSGYVDDQLDCDDSEPSIYPGAVEIQGNGIDDNCDAVIS